MSQFRQFWIKDFVVFKTHERYADGASAREAYDKPAPNRKIHVIEIAALEAAQKEIERLKYENEVYVSLTEPRIEQLTAALKVAEDALNYVTEDFDCPAEDVAVYDMLRAKEALDKIQKIKKGLG